MPPRTTKLPMLSETHNAIFNFLLEVNRTQNVNAILRVAGGWVRDTLLGVPSHDIDVAIETPSGSAQLITGAAFATEIVNYQKSHSMETRTLSVIRTNPERSKHIETAQLCVFDIPLEFCHLRHDEYSHESRVPVVRPGTPLEDAQRRDFTVNALFYNLHTQLVEDFTTGLEDLEAKVLRTPLQPAETFLDDPLRLLRGIRFAGQLGFALEDSVTACVDGELLGALQTKISRERLGVEWAKMMGGNRPDMCWEYVTQMGLVDAVMQELYLKKGKAKGPTEIASVVNMVNRDDEERVEVMKSYWQLLNTCGLPLLSNSHSAAFQASKDDRMAAAMFLITLPFYSGEASDVRLERISAWSTNSLKQPVATSLALRKMFDGFDFLSTIDFARHIAESASTVHRMRVVGEARETIFNALMCLTEKAVPPNALPVLILANILTRNRHTAVTPTFVAHEVHSIVDFLKGDATLLSSVSAQLPLDGKEIAEVLQVPNKEIGNQLLRARKAMLHNPRLSRDELIAALRADLRK